MYNFYLYSAIVRILLYEMYDVNQNEWNYVEDTTIFRYKV